MGLLLPVPLAIAPLPSDASLVEESISRSHAFLKAILCASVCAFLVPSESCRPGFAPAFSRPGEALPEGHDGSAGGNSSGEQLGEASRREPAAASALLSGPSRRARWAPSATCRPSRASPPWPAAVPGGAGVLSGACVPAHPRQPPGGRSSGCKGAGESPRAALGYRERDSSCVPRGDPSRSVRTGRVLGKQVPPAQNPSFLAITSASPLALPDSTLTLSSFHITPEVPSIIISSAPVSQLLSASPCTSCQDPP